MRISTTKGHPGYVLWEELIKSGAKIEVFFDGIKQEWVCMADDQHGLIERAVMTPDNKLQTDPDYPDRILTEFMIGKVQILINGTVP